MEENKSDVIRVTIEFKDGEIRQITGDKAKQWIDAVDQMIIIGYTHGEQMPKIDWELKKNNQK